MSALGLSKIGPSAATPIHELSGKGLGACGLAPCALEGPSEPVVAGCGSPPSVPGLIHELSGLLLLKLRALAKRDSRGGGVGGKEREGLEGSDDGRLLELLPPPSSPPPPSPPPPPPPPPSLLSCGVAFVALRPLGLVTVAGVAVVMVAMAMVAMASSPARGTRGGRGGVQQGGVPHVVVVGVPNGFGWFLGCG